MESGHSGNKDGRALGLSFLEGAGAELSYSEISGDMQRWNCNVKCNRSRKLELDYGLDILVLAVLFL